MPPMTPGNYASHTHTHTLVLVFRALLWTTMETLMGQALPGFVAWALFSLHSILSPRARHCRTKRWKRAWYATLWQYILTRMLMVTTPCLLDCLSNIAFTGGSSTKLMVRTPSLPPHDTSQARASTRNIIELIFSYHWAALSWCGSEESGQ